MSHYLASKGSTAWEQAVKGRKEITEDDVVPVGWRILEKEAQSPVMGTSKTQKSGGFFSFLNRRDSKVSISAAAVVNRSQSPASTSKATAPSERAASSTRGSQDSRRSISIARISEVAAPSSTVASPAPSTPPVALPSTHPSTLSTANSVPQTPSSGGSYADAPDPVFERTQSPPPAPSAVSRFLGRFSRRRTAVPTSSPHASIALSSDDLEFLSDIVPSVTDDPADDPLEQLTRSSVMRAEPLPPILPPPPLAPPSAPPSSFPPPRSHSITKNGAIPPPSLVPTQIGTSKASPTQAPSQTNGLDSFFDTWESEALGPEKPISSSRSSTPKSMGSSPLQPIPATKLPPSSSRPHSPAAFALPPHNSRPTSPSPLNHGLSVVRPPSQPLLPPPPSSGSQSLSTTSIPPQEGSAQLVASGLRPLSRSSSIGRSGSHQSHPLRPKVPLSFTIPPPPSSQRISSASSSTSPDSPKSAIESALPTPTSARPLSELYPDAVRRNNGPAPPSLATNPHPSSSFVIPPPPSQSHTLALLDTTFPHSRPAPPPLPLLAPPLSQAAPATSFDDDDFSDFQSSATVPSSNPPLAAPVFNTLPQGSAQSATLPGPSSFLTPLPPPPKSSTGSSWAPGTPSRSITLANNFSSFRSPSPSPVRPHASPSSDFDSSFTSNHSNQGLLPHPSTPSSFDDWDSFNTNPLRTPSPPRLPSKTRASFPAPPAGASSHGLGHSTKPKTNLRIVSTSSPPGSPKMRNREAEHQHTLSLVEMAAARQGQWPAPPSPLPPPLAYPFPATGKSAKHAVDLISDLDGDDNDKGDIANSGFGVGEIDESFGKFGSSDGLMVSSSVSSPAMLNPARPSMFSSTSSSMVPPNFSQSQSLQTVSSTGSNQWLLNTTGPSLTNGNGTKGSSNAGGGLSAQDLSFFEGL